MRQNTQNIILGIANERTHYKKSTLHFQKHINHTALCTVNSYYKVNPEPQLQGKNPNVKLRALITMYNPEIQSKDPNFQVRTLISK